MASGLTWKKHYFPFSFRENPFSFLLHSVFGLWQVSQKGGSCRSSLLISLAYLWMPDMQGPVFKFNTWHLTPLSKLPGRLDPIHLCNFHITRELPSEEVHHLFDYLKKFSNLEALHRTCTWKFPVFCTCVVSVDLHSSTSRLEGKLCFNLKYMQQQAEGKI